VECQICKSKNLKRIELKRAVIYQCLDCLSLWLETKNSLYRLMPILPQPTVRREEEYNLICPHCWSKLEVDYENNEKYCPISICGYRKRLPGPTLSEREKLKDFKKIRQKLFKETVKGEVSKETIALYLKAKEETESLRRQYGET